MTHRKPIVLFLCTGNTARSQIAEALLRHHARDQFQAFSAGLRPKDEVHPLTLRVLEEIGIDVAPLHPKGVESFMRKASVHHYRLREGPTALSANLPLRSSDPLLAFDDPTAALGTEEERPDVFRRVRNQIEDKLFQWLELTVERR